MTHITCPICGAGMDRVAPGIVIRDGNLVWQCQADRQHRFWKNGKLRTYILYQDPSANGRKGAKELRKFAYEPVTTFEYKEI